MLEVEILRVGKVGLVALKLVSSADNTIYFFKSIL